LENDPINTYFPGITDPKAVQFLEQYDEAETITDFLRHGIFVDFHGEEQDLIACVNTEFHAAVIWLYDDSGALVYW
jgi:hypothetical protein